MNSFQTEHEEPDFASVYELAENLVYRLRECPDLLVRKTIREVFREYCRETQSLSSRQRIPLAPEMRICPIATAYGGVAVAVRDVRIEGSSLRIVVDYTLSPDRKAIVLSPRFVAPPRHNNPDQALLPTPPEAERHIHEKPRALSYVVVEVPKIDSERAPSWFVQQHGDAIVSGVMARLCSMQGRPWSDPVQAHDELARYENAKSEQRMSVEAPANGIFVDTSLVL